MTRILFILPNLCIGGAERVTLTVMRHLDRERYQPSLFLIKDEGGLWEEVPDDVEVFTGLKQGLRMRWHMTALIRRLLIAARKADIIVGVLEYDSIYLAVLAGLIAKRPVVGWIHTNMVHYPRRTLVDYLLPRLLYPRVRYMITVSQGVADSVGYCWPWIKPRVCTIYNPFDTDLINSKVGSAAAETEKSDIPLVLGVGRLVESKNYSLLIRAHAELLSRRINQRLIIVGEGPDRRNLEKLIRNLGVEGSVDLPGIKVDPYESMRSASCLVLSSHYEGFGMVLLEAMLLGVPVVAVNCPSGPEELLGGGKYGLLLPPDNLEEMVKAISIVLTNRERAEQLRHAGLERVEHFRPECRMPEFDELLSKAARLKKKDVQGD